MKKLAHKIGPLAAALPALFLFITLSAYPQSIDEEEVKTVKPVEFENYLGPHENVDTHDEIIGIGKSLKLGLDEASQSGDGESQQYTWKKKYTIIRAYQPGADKLSADIIVIEKSAKVDNIYNVRRIITGYLQQAYGYIESEAFVIATFITYYNAVHRSDIQYFESKYTQKVLSHLTPQTVGIALSYRDWRGKTAIVIPLAAGAPSTADITSEEIIEHLRDTQEDRAVDDRQDILDIQKAELLREEKELEARKEAAQQKEEEINGKQAQIDAEREKLDEIEDPQERAEKEAELDNRQEELDAEKEELAVTKAEIARDEETLEAKRQEIESSEAGIALDEKRNLYEQDPDKAIAEIEAAKKAAEEARKDLQIEQEGIMDGKLYYLKVREWEREGHYDNEMFIIEPDTREVLARSTVERIDCDKFLLNDKGVVVVIHNDEEPAKHTLVLLDKNNLSLIKEGGDDVFWRSFIEDREGQIYVIVSRYDGYYLGRFNYDLELEIESDVKIDRDSFISFYKETIYINRDDKTVVLLNKADLTYITEITP